MKISNSCNHCLALFSLCIGLVAFNSVRAQRSALSPSVSQAQLSNNSTRVTVGTNDAISVDEFAIQGSQPKKIILRGIGPSLTSIPNRLQDPVLSLYDSSGALLARNDNWRDSQEADIAATGIPPSDNRESAIVATLAPGTYAAVLVGKNHTTGIGINEIYDLEQQNSLFTGIGARGNVLPDPGQVISGFALTGNQSQTLLLRALGPSLAGAGIGGAVIDPALALYNGNGQQMAFNDNWQDTQASEIQATGMAPTDYRESAIVVTLPPGFYSLKETRSSGITFLEEYALPYGGKTLNPAPTFAINALAFSRKIHGATAYDVSLPLTGAPGIECRSGGGSDAYQVVVTFLNTVTFNSAEITSGTGTVTSATGSGTKIATLNITGVLSAQTIQITLAGVDDGVIVTDIVIPMSVLVGDSSGNGVVNASDISSIKMQSGNSIVSSNFREDLNADGSINSVDVAFVKSKSGTALPSMTGSPLRGIGRKR